MPRSNFVENNISNVGRYLIGNSIRVKYDAAAQSEFSHFFTMNEKDVNSNVCEIFASSYQYNGVTNIT